LRGAQGRPLDVPERIGRLRGLAIIGAMAIANVVWTLQTWPDGDFGTYWTAAERIRDRGPLYVGDDPSSVRSGEPVIHDVGS
jgi:hypothetical protein